MWLIYTSCAIALIAVALLAAAPLWGFPAAGWACLLGLALGPQLLGHSVFNWALKHVSATFIALTILGEPIGASLLALLLFGESLSTLQSAGFGALLIGIYLAARSEKTAGEPGAARD
ncbi:MAG: DMT family transporter [Pseudomonadota bacterium]